MIEYQGWIVLQGHWMEEKDDEVDIDHVVDILRKKIASIYFGNDVCANNTISPDIDNKFGVPPIHIKLIGLNGNFRLVFIGAANRRPHEFEELLQIINFIAIQAPGSYGIMHYWDSDQQGDENNYRCLSLKRGSIYTDIELRLSPVCEKI